MRRCILHKSCGYTTGQNVNNRPSVKAICNIIWNTTPQQTCTRYETTKVLNKIKRVMNDVHVHVYRCIYLCTCNVLLVCLYFRY
eukprot:m.123836 g.123836  ORF g.123836 m.123836 type:complete len:84 (+) comp12950_c0_seq17:516-767(+)